MVFKIIRNNDQESVEEPVKSQTPSLEGVATPEVKPTTPDTPFRKALNDEKEHLTKRIGELEGELQSAKDLIKTGTEKKENIATEAEDIARRMKAIDAMSKIY